MVVIVCPYPSRPNSSSQIVRTPTVITSSQDLYLKSDWWMGGCSCCISWWHASFLCNPVWWVIQVSAPSVTLSPPPERSRRWAAISQRGSPDGHSHEMGTHHHLVMRFELIGTFGACMLGRRRCCGREQLSSSSSVTFSPLGMFSAPHTAHGLIPYGF